MSIQERYKAFVEKYGCEPNYVSAIIQWKDSGMLGAFEDVIIKLSNDVDEHDDEVFYYVHGISDLEVLTKDNGEDFYVLEGTVNFLISLD